MPIRVVASHIPQEGVRARHTGGPVHLNVAAPLAGAAALAHQEVVQALPGEKRGALPAIGDFHGGEGLIHPRKVGVQPHQCQPRPHVVRPVVQGVYEQVVVPYAPLPTHAHAVLEGHKGPHGGGGGGHRIPRV